METIFENSRKWIVTSMIVWMIAKPLFIAIKLWGIESTELPGTDLRLPMLFLGVTATGLIDGFIFGLIDTAHDRKYPRASFARSVASKSLLNLLSGLILTIVLLPCFSKMHVIDGIVFLYRTLIVTNIVIVAIYMFLITFFLQVWKVAASWIQTHDLGQIFSIHSTGVEEDRIFMFLDMKSSTHLAEGLGAFKYSLMIQDCFRDMTKSVQETQAEIYQYVGDEIIFTWKTTDANLERSVQHFFSIRENLHRRSSYYIDQYGLVPEFKAGIHHGSVIRTHVGEMRKCVAFHGDTVNTASRIQGKCSELGHDLLVSSVIAEALPRTYFAEYKGTFVLRGKQSGVELFSVQSPVREEQVVLVSQPIDPVKIRIPSFRIWLNVF